MRIISLVTDSLRRRWAWLRRVPRTRGFGVQSPWAYGMIRYVIHERYPYYAYDDLAKSFPALGGRERALGELYLRLSNAVGRRVWSVGGRGDDYRAAYIRAGCRASTVVGRDAAAAGEGGACDVLVFSSVADCRRLFEPFARRSDAGALLIVEHIHRSKEFAQVWREIQESHLAGISFDLYDCGLVFFDMAMHKRSYAVNLR